MSMWAVINSVAIVYYVHKPFELYLSRGPDWSSQNFPIPDVVGLLRGQVDYKIWLVCLCYDSLCQSYAI